MVESVEKERKIVDQLYSKYQGKAANCEQSVKIAMLMYFCMGNHIRFGAHCRKALFSVKYSINTVKDGIFPIKPARMDALP